MKNLILIGSFLLLPLTVGAASVDYYLKIDGVDGEVKSSVVGGVTTDSGSAVVGAMVYLDGSRSVQSGTTQRFLWKQTGGPTVTLTNPATAKASFVPKAAGTYTFELSVTDNTGLSALVRRVQVVVLAKAVVPIPATQGSGTVKANDPTESKGDIDMQWKVEEGEKSATPGVEPDEIDYDGDEPQQTNFSVLLGGKVDVDGDGDASDTDEEGLTKALEVLTREAQASDAAIEHVSLNYEKISTKVRHQVQLLGFIPLQATATVDIDADGKASVRFPWWSFLASIPEREGLGQHISDILDATIGAHADALTDGLLIIR